MSKIDNNTLKELLVSPGHITLQEFDAAAAVSEKKKMSLYDAIAEAGYMLEENLAHTIADYLDYRFVNLNDVLINDEFLNLIPEVVARAQRAVFFGKENGILKLATSNTDSYEFVKLLEKKVGSKIAIFYAAKSGIREALRYYKGDMRQKVKDLILCCAERGDEGDVVSLVNLIMEYAYDSRASDIHLEPLEDSVLVRFRIDGILHEAASYSKKMHEKIVFRIKIMSGLQTDEQSAAQDGRFEYKAKETSFDVRVSVIPITRGENVVMRLLASHNQEFTLNNIGLSEEGLNKVVSASNRPHGMILAVGPTGSGKTTTLYSILRMLNKPEINTMTIEDPVEYDMNRIQQTQVNPRKKLTFATGLRSIVRQDPDIIMVGEIRDEETADIAVNAAMTGHLLLSTLHTNDAATTFPRLLEMNVEPFLVASSVNVVISQRLVRKICSQCRKSHIINKSEREVLKINPRIGEELVRASGIEDISKMRLYRGDGCKVCGQSGFSGRVGLFEILEVGEEIRSLIVEKASASSISEKAIQLGMTPLISDGLKKVINGLTTLEEVVKASKI